MKRSFLALANVLVLVGCSIDLRSNSGYCESNDDCGPGSECVVPEGRESGLCAPVQGMDGGPDAATDGGTDGGIDGGLDGSTCTPGAACYSGPADTDGVGPCHAGIVDCSSGTAVCRDEATPAEDDATCDGVDDDCDGAEDEDAPALMDCLIGQPGVCMQGEVRCAEASYRCMPLSEASSERCNALDDDCDNEVDEDTDFDCYPPEATGCTLGGDGSYACTGVCATGRLACTDGTPSCVGPTLPADGDGCTESGPALDDDCDGSIDEDCTEPCTDAATRECYTGSATAAGQGTCSLGMQTCSGGTWSACVGSVLPGAETCDNSGFDDDCNGTVDDIEGAGGACLDESAVGVCRQGALMCDAGSLTCITPDPVAEEACDERDDDCDGSVDEAFDFMTDENHCGACNQSCGPGRTCCGGTCVDTSRDADHCGDCDTMCGEDQGCCGGTCMPLLDNPLHCGACGNACTGGQICCGGACVDPRSDAANCGACGAPCAEGLACCDGTCADPLSTQCTECTMDCTAGQTCCAPSCTDTSSDPANCGGCGVDFACTGDADTCCDSACVDTDTDEANCGACGTSCAEGETCCGGACVTTGDDVFNCGACGTACDPGELCCGGACADPASDATHCGSCEVDCTVLGQSCSNSNCCQDGFTYCAGPSSETTGCFNTQVEEAHCGGCNRPCAAGQLCCDGACVNPNDNEAHCGSCGNGCSQPQETCCSGSCVDADSTNAHCGDTCTTCGFLTHCSARQCVVL